MSDHNGTVRSARLRLSRHAVVRLTARTAMTVAVVGLFACISERPTGPGDLAGCNLQLSPQAFGSAIVIARNLAFTPPLVRIRPGTKVTWVNCDAPGAESHTSTSNAAGWNSPLLAPGASYTREFIATGSFPYHCEVHPGMTGTVTVE